MHLCQHCKRDVLKLVLFREQGQYSVGFKSLLSFSQTQAIFLCDYRGLQTSPIYGFSPIVDIAELAQSSVDAGRGNWQGPHNKNQSSKQIFGGMLPFVVCSEWMTVHNFVTADRGREIFPTVFIDVTLHLNNIPRWWSGDAVGACRYHWRLKNGFL